MDLMGHEIDSSALRSFAECVIRTFQSDKQSRTSDRLLSVEKLRYSYREIFLMA